MSSKEIGQIVCTAFDDFARKPSTGAWDELRERLLTWFRTLDEAAAFDGMLWIFEHSDRYQHQLLAGDLLLRRGVPLHIPVGEFIRRVAPRLNASAREVVEYLEAQLGREEALRQVHEVRSDDPAVRSGIDTFRYFLGEHPGMD